MSEPTSLSLSTELSGAVTDTATTELKPPEIQSEVGEVKIAAVMSVPMCGWNPHWGCTAAALRPFGIPIRLAYGAYWHQSMSNLLEDCCDEGGDWVLTLDYDSVFRPEDLDRLLGRFGSRPEIDALAALQCKRGTDDAPLMSAGVSELQVTGDVLPADTAHFGMTLIRLDALRRMPKPWFLGRPDENGSYRTSSRVDADIYFWHKWKETGNTLAVDPMVAIGHLQPVVAEYDEHFNVVYTHWPVWRARGRGDL